MLSDVYKHRRYYIYMHLEKDRVVSTFHILSNFTMTLNIIKLQYVSIIQDKKKKQLMH